MPGKYIDVSFTRNSAFIGVDELARVSAWSAEMKQYDIVDLVAVHGLAEGSEADSRMLAKKRASKVWQALRQFGITPERSEVVGLIYKTSHEPRDPSDQNGRRVEVSLYPGCPNHCCDGQ